MTDENNQPQSDWLNTMEPKSSVKLTKNAKGNIQWEIKCVKGEEKLIEGIVQAAINTHEILEEKFKDLNFNNLNKNGGKNDGKSISDSPGN